MVESTYRQYLDGTIMQSVSNDTLNPRGYALPFGHDPQRHAHRDQRRLVNSHDEARYWH